MSGIQSPKNAGGDFRYSPEQEYRPRVSPPSVEDRDACAIYASVRKDATPSHEPIRRAIPALQKMLHRAGNVDGEGDGCGVLLDIPRKAAVEVWVAHQHHGLTRPPALQPEPAIHDQPLRIRPTLAVGFHRVPWDGIRGRLGQ